MHILTTYLKRAFLFGLLAIIVILVIKYVNAPIMAQSQSITIQGSLTNQDGQPISKAKIVLYKGDNLKGVSKTTDEKGQYRITNLKVLQGSTYSLKIEAQGYASDKAAFTARDADPSTGAIVRNFVLKSTSVDSGGAASTETRGSSVKTTPGREGTVSQQKSVQYAEPVDRSIEEILGPLRYWIYALVLSVGLIALAALFLLIRDIWRPGSSTARPVGEELSEICRHLDMSVGGLGTINQELQNRLSEILAVQLQLHKLYELCQKQQTHAAEHFLQIQVSPSAEPSLTQPPEPTSQPPEPTLRATHPVQENFLERAKVAYEDLLKGNKPLSLDPLYLEFDTNRTPGSELEEERISLKVTCSLQSPFVLFCERSSEGGWLFPNPTRLYTEDMGRVFTGLTREHISQQKQNIIPVEVQKVGNGRWQVV